LIHQLLAGTHSDEDDRFYQHFGAQSSIEGINQSLHRFPHVSANRPAQREDSYEYSLNGCLAKMNYDGLFSHFMDLSYLPCAIEDLLKRDSSEVAVSLTPVSDDEWHIWDHQPRGTKQSRHSTRE
jgi:hypothetical protein